MRQEWVAFVEGVCVPAAFDYPALRRLLHAVRDCSPVALHTPDCCGLQLRVSADGPADALSLALRRWHAAVDDLGDLHWNVVRAEVVTVEQFERECEAASRAGDASPPARAEQARDLSVGADLLRLAFEDPLTGMETAGPFACRLDDAGARGRAPGDTSALVVVDLDGFKALNERFGTEVGDQLLAGVASRLRTVLGGAGRPARLGGDRFAVLLEHASQESAVSTAERFLDALRPPFRVKGDDVVVSASIGVAVGLHGDGSSLLDNATAAVTGAKVSDRGGVQVFRPGSEVDEPASDAAVSSSRLDETLLLQRRAAAAAADSTGLTEAATRVLPDVCVYAGWPLAHLCLVDPASGEFTATPGWYSSDANRFGAIQEAVTASPTPVDPELSRRVRAGREPEWTAELHGGAVPSSWLTAAGLHAVVLVPVLAGDEVVAALQCFAEDRREPQAAVLHAVGLVGVLLAPAAHRTGIEASPGPGGNPTPAFVPLRYELFGWEPEQPAPGLDAFLPRRGTGDAAGKDLWQALTLMYERLAGAVAGRSAATADKPPGPGVS